MILADKWGSLTRHILSLSRAVQEAVVVAEHLTAKLRCDQKQSLISTGLWTNRIDMN